MTTGFKLGLPIDIPWKRICVTEDMVDRVVCDKVLPPKWHSSIVVFKYRPADEFQLYPDYDITYLKVTCTITGYQPIEDEIQGQIDWNGIDVTTLEGVTELLSSYSPCTGAILQIVVGPSRQRDDVPLDRYPFFMDFEPKKRELYEMATDTNERQSRSIESLSLGKSSGTTKSLEVLDVDMGGSTGFGMQAQYAGTGGGFNFSSSNQGQWGTKSMNTEDSQTTRNAELGTERRETQSFTTQLSQMYHLLDSYHVGTNRAIFFMQPRPHVLEEATGFVRGPRKVEGIQEFFLIVAAPKAHPDYCVSARLDTGHLVETDVLDYETRSEYTDLASASAHVPTKNDMPAGTTTREACFIGCWDVTYHCYRTHDVDDVIYGAPTGFEITSYVDLVNQHDAHGSTGVTLSPDHKVLTVHAEADGHICFEGDEVCFTCDDDIEKWSGWARRQVQVQLRSTERIKKVDTRSSLLITTRGLCCCPDVPVRPTTGVYVVDLPRDLAVIPVTGRTPTGPPLSTHAPDQPTITLAYGIAKPAASGCSCGGENPSRVTAYPAIRRANAISEVIRQELTKRVASEDLRPWHSSILETDLFVRQLEGVISRSRYGRELLTKPMEYPRALAKVLATRLKRKPEELSRRDILRFQADDLARASGVEIGEIRRLKLATLGLAARRKTEDGEEKKQKPGTAEKKAKTKRGEEKG
jgi:hypothetical protein